MSLRSSTYSRMWDKTQPLSHYQRKLTTRTRYKNWKLMIDFFGDRPINGLEIMLFAYHLQGARYYVRHAIRAYKALHPDFMLKVYPYATTMRNKYIGIQEHIKNLKKYSDNYTVYSFLCAYSVLRFYKVRMSFLRKLKLKDYTSGEMFGHSLPKWLTIILDRQYELALNAGLSQDDPLFFVMRKNKIFGEENLYLGSFNRADLVETEEKIEYFCDYNILDWVENSRTFYGMQKDAIIFTNTMKYNSGRYITNRYRKFGYSTASLHKYKVIGRYTKDYLKHQYVKRENYSMASIYGYLEYGVFMAETPDDGPCYVPAYLVTHPFLSMTLPGSKRYRDQIVSMGHISQEELDTMRGTLKLSKRRIWGKKF